MKSKALQQNAIWNPETFPLCSNSKIGYGAFDQGHAKGGVPVGFEWVGSFETPN